MQSVSPIVTRVVDKLSSNPLPLIVRMVFKYEEPVICRQIYKLGSCTNGITISFF